MRARPIVDGLEQEYAGRADVLVINAVTPLGRDIIRQQNVRSTPSMLVYDGQGNVVYHKTGVQADEVRAAVDALLS